MRNKTKLYLVMNRTIKKHDSGYKMPELDVVDICAERGFGNSSMLDNMYETEGNWY